MAKIPVFGLHTARRLVEIAGKPTVEESPELETGELLLFVGRTTVAHPQGATKPVDIMVGVKGAEDRVIATLPVFNRASGDLPPLSFITVVNINSGLEVLASPAGSSGAGFCPCNCLETGDITANGVETTSKWSITLGAERFVQDNGVIILPAGTYIVEWDVTSETWILDISDFLVAEYNDGSDATGDTTMDGTLTLEYPAAGQPNLKLCVDGTIPAP